MRGALYKLQIIEGAEAFEESQNDQSRERMVTAAPREHTRPLRPQMVTNRECYNLKINTDKLFSDDVEDPNAVILEMVRIVEESGNEYIDDLPITDSPPYEYTENMTAPAAHAAQRLLRRQGPGRGHHGRGAHELLPHAL